MTDPTPVTPRSSLDDRPPKPVDTDGSGGSVASVMGDEAIRAKATHNGALPLDERGQIPGQLSIDDVAGRQTLREAAGGPDGVVALIMETFPGTELLADDPPGA